MRQEHIQFSRDHSSASEGEVFERERKFHEAIEWVLKPESIKKLVLGAHLARKNAENYRNFKVGAIVVGTVGENTRYGQDLSNLSENEYAVDPLAISPDSNIDVTYGGNFRPTPDAVHGRDKRCAERNCLEMAIEDNKDEIIAAMITESDRTSTESDNEDEHDVLKPCDECIEYFKTLLDSGNLRLETVLIGSKVGDQDLLEDGETLAGKVQISTIGELLKTYEAHSQNIKN